MALLHPQTANGKAVAKITTESFLENPVSISRNDAVNATLEKAKSAALRKLYQMAMAAPEGILPFLIPLITANRINHANISAISPPI